MAVPLSSIISYPTNSGSVSLSSSSVPISSSSIILSTTSLPASTTNPPSSIPSATAKQNPTISSSISSASASASSTTSSTLSSSTTSSTPTASQASQPFQNLGGPAGLAGIITAVVATIVIAIVFTLYFCRRRDARPHHRPKSRADSKRSTLPWGSRVGPWRLNVNSSTPMPEDNWDSKTNRKSHRTTGTSVHKEFPEIVVLDARPSTDNSAVSLPYAVPQQQGPLHLTMPFTPPDDLISKQGDDEPPERYIPYVPPKQHKRSQSASTLPQPRRSSLNGANPYPNPHATVPRQPGTNSVSAAVPASQRTSMVVSDNNGYGRHGRSSSTSSINMSHRASQSLPPTIIIPPKGQYSSRYSPHHSPATVTEETESELGEEAAEMDLTDINMRTRREQTARECGRKTRTSIAGTTATASGGELYKFMRAGLGDWDDEQYRYEGDSEAEAQQIPQANARGRYRGELGNRF